MQAVFKLSVATVWGLLSFQRIFPRSVVSLIKACSEVCAHLKAYIMYSSSLSSLDSKKNWWATNELPITDMIVVKGEEPPIKLLLIFSSAIGLSMVEIVKGVYSWFLMA